jgi:anti-sigma regulatory factor (Ser/Thr protein kinase)
VSVRSARELVRETLRLHGLDSGVAQVLVSELTANAVRHARTDFTVGISVGDVVRIEVGDGELTLEGLDTTPADGRQTFGEEAEARAEPGWPERTRPERFGLLLVDAFADRWGVDLVPTGKRVWCELDAGRLAARPATSSRADRATEPPRG